MANSIGTSISAPPGWTDRRGTPAVVAVSVTGLSKAFNGVPALRDVSMDFRAGEVHALMGANGSGKSTLVKLLTGAERADRGTLRAREHEVPGFQSPQQALALGFRVVHQEAPLVDTLSVAEVVALHLGYPKGGAGLVRWRKVPDVARQCMSRVGLDVHPARLAGSLSASQRALLAISIALATSPDEVALLILDEATAKINREEARSLLGRVRALADDGLAVLMVTHRVAEAAEFGDHLSVLEAGAAVHSGPMPKNPDVVYRVLRRVGSSAPEEHGEDDLARWQAATTEPRQLWDGPQASRERAPSTVAARRPKNDRRLRAHDPGEDRHPEVREAELLGVEDLTADRLKGLSFSLKPGEVVGIVGGPGSGAEELPRALAGLGPAARGRLRLGAGCVRLPRSPKEALRRGIALVPSDRLHHGAVGVMSIFENIVLPTSRGFSYWGARNKRMVTDVIEQFAVAPANPGYLVSALSGGNQQKVIVGKWLSTHPQLLILDDPTVGVDPWSRQRLFEVVARHTREGLRVLLLSSEPEQLVEHCDRVLAVDGGLIVEELTGEGISDHNVARWSMA